jgi:hypothetical protein
MGIQHACKDFMQNGQCVVCLGERVASTPLPPPTPPSATGINPAGGRMSARPIIGKIDAVNSMGSHPANPKQLNEAVQVMKKYEEGAWSGTQFTTASDEKIFNPRVPRDNPKNLPPVGHSHDHDE